MIPLSSISEAVKNHDDTKIFRPADYDDFMRWLDYADTEEKLFSRLGYWMVMQGLPDDRNQKYDMVRERAQELSSGMVLNSNSGVGWTTLRKKSKDSARKRTPL